MAPAGREVSGAMKGQPVPVRTPWTRRLGAGLAPRECAAALRRSIAASIRLSPSNSYEANLPGIRRAANGQRAAQWAKGHAQQLSFWTGRKWGGPRTCWARRNPARPAGWETCDTADWDICATDGGVAVPVAQTSKSAVSPTSKSAGVRCTGGARTKSGPRVRNSYGRLRCGGVPAPLQNGNCWRGHESYGPVLAGGGVAAICPLFRAPVSTGSPAATHSVMPPA